MSNRAAPALNSAFERQLIRELLDRAFFALDARDQAMLASCFSPEATAVFHKGYGNEISLSKRAEVAAYILSGTNPYSNHLTSNQIIELDGDKARVLTHAIATVVPATGNIRVRGLRYVDEVSRHGDDWLIDSRTHIPLWQYESPSVAAGPLRNVSG